MSNSANNPFFQTLRIIVVEDSHELREILVAGLTYLGHHVQGVNDGTALDSAMADAPADVVILDLGLPGEDGIAIAKRLRHSCSCGIVMVTARGRLDDRVLGREVGADLYFVKPVDLRELNAGLLNLAQRLQKQAPPRWFFSAMTSTLITPRGVKIPLTAHECILLAKLLATPGTNISRSEIFRAFNQPDDIYADKRLEALVSRLRGKVRTSDAENELPVRARHNFGYAFLAEAEQAGPGTN